MILYQFLKNCAKLMLKTYFFAAYKKGMKECKELLEIRYLLLSVTVPLQLLVTAI